LGVLGVQEGSLLDGWESVEIRTGYCNGASNLVHINETTALWSRCRPSHRHTTHWNCSNLFTVNVEPTTLERWRGCCNSCLSGSWWTEANTVKISRQGCGKATLLCEEAYSTPASSCGSIEHWGLNAQGGLIVEIEDSTIYGLTGPYGWGRHFELRFLWVESTSVQKCTGARCSDSIHNDLLVSAFKVHKSSVCLRDCCSRRNTTYSQNIGRGSASDIEGTTIIECLGIGNSYSSRGPPISI
jgi:hypothetical protein